MIKYAYLYLLLLQVETLRGGKGMVLFCTAVGVCGFIADDDPPPRIP